MLVLIVSNNFVENYTFLSKLSVSVNIQWSFKSNFKQATIEFILKKISGNLKYLFSLKTHDVCTIYCNFRNEVLKGCPGH